MKKRIVYTLLIALAVFGVIFGYKFYTLRQARAAAVGMKPPPAVVTTHVAMQETWRSTQQAVGTVESFRGVTVRAEIAGRIVRVAFDSGAVVKAGDVLIEFDTATEIAQLHGLEARGRLAEVSLERARELRKNNTNAQADLDTAEATATEALAAVEELRATLAKKRVVAPFDGQLGIRQVSPGQFLNMGGDIVTLEAVDPAYFDFGLPQQEIGRVQPGQEVHVTVDAFAGRQFGGKIEAVNPRVTGETRNVLIRAILPNHDGVLRPGMFGRVEVQLPEANSVIVVPATAITYSPYGDSVYVVVQQHPDGGGEPQLVAKQQFVTVGASRGDQISIIKGIKAGDQVVTAGQMKLRNGVFVRVNNDITPPNNPAPKPAES